MPMFPGLHRVAATFGRVVAVAAISSAAAPAWAQHAGCGGDVACRIEGADYRIEVPAGTRGVLVWFHGYKSSAAQQMTHRALVEAATGRGLAFAAVDGLDGTWAHPNAPGTARDEIAATAAVLDDIRDRFGFGPDQVILGGFSQGASMAYYAACALGPRMSGLVVVSGSFWDPIPEHCAPGFPPLVHFHGTADRTFPLEGRAIGAAHRQGDTRAGFAMLARSAACGPTLPPAPGSEAGVPAPGLACAVTPDCARGQLTLCLHGGGHEVDPAMLAAGLAALGR